MICDLLTTCYSDYISVERPSSIDTIIIRWWICPTSYSSFFGIINFIESCLFFTTTCCIRSDKNWQPNEFCHWPWTSSRRKFHSDEYVNKTRYKITMKIKQRLIIVKKYLLLFVFVYYLITVNFILIMQINFWIFQLYHRDWRVDVVLFSSRLILFFIHHILLYFVWYNYRLVVFVFFFISFFKMMQIFVPHVSKLAIISVSRESLLNVVVRWLNEFLINI